MGTAWIYPAGPLGDEKRNRWHPMAFGVTNWANFLAAPLNPGFNYPKVREQGTGTDDEDQLWWWLAIEKYPTQEQLDTGQTFVSTLVDVGGKTLVWYADVASLAQAAKAAGVFASDPKAPQPSPIKEITGELEIFLDPPQRQTAGLGWLALIGVVGLAWWVYKENR